MQKWFVWMLCLLLVSGCSHASVDGQIHVKINSDGSGRYQFTILTHPLVIDTFQKYQTELKQNQFHIKPLTKGKKVGWIATKQVENLFKEPPPLSIPTFAQSQRKHAVHINKGFFTTHIRVNYPLDLTQITEEHPLVLLIKDRIHLDLVVSLPIPLEEHNATTISKDKKTATWQLKVGEVNPIRAKVTIPNPVGWIVTIAGGLVLVLFAFIIILIMKKRKNN